MGLFLDSIMAGDWIKFEHVTPDKPEVWKIADILGIDADAVVGKLVRIWIWADQQTTDGNAGSVTSAMLDRISGVTGFVAAMTKAGWLEQSEGGFRFVNFDRHNGETAKQRALTAKRVQKHRAKGTDAAPPADNSNAGSVTPPLSEKNTGEKIDSSGGARAKDADQLFIPTAVDIPKCHEAFNAWCDYLEKSGLDVQSPRLNTIQAQMIWRNAHRLGADKWIKCVELSIRNGYKQIVQNPDRPKGESKKDFDPDFLKAVKVCKEYPSGSDYDREKREQALGPQLIRIVRHMTTARLAEVDRYTQKAMAAEWEIVRETQL